MYNYRIYIGPAMEAIGLNDDLIAISVHGGYGQSLYLKTGNQWPANGQNYTFFLKVIRIFLILNDSSWIFME